MVEQLHKVPIPPFSDSLRQQCRSRLLGCLAELNNQTRSLKLGAFFARCLSNPIQCSTEEDRAIKCPGIASDGEFWVSKVVDTIERLKEDTKRVALLADSDETDLALHKKVKDTVEQLRRVGSV